MRFCLNTGRDHNETFNGFLSHDSYFLSEDLTLNNPNGFVSEEPLLAVKLFTRISFIMKQGCYNDNIPAIIDEIYNCVGVFAEFVFMKMFVAIAIIPVLLLFLKMPR